MIRAMIVKELRETWWIAAIGLALYAYMVWNLMAAPHLHHYGPRSLAVTVLAMVPGAGSEVPFIGSEFTSSFWLISILLALALGFRQSLPESAQGTYLFLLHRPWRRESFFLAKLAIGCGLLLACAALPIVVYGAWVATPGHVAAPFHWSMTLGAWVWWSMMPAIYLAAFLVGLRPVTWLGTRLLPLAAVTAAVGILQAIYANFGLTALLLFGLAAVYAALTNNIRHVARTRDYS